MKTPKPFPKLIAVNTKSKTLLMKLLYTAKTAHQLDK